MATERTPSDPLSERGWVIAAVAVFLIGAILRLANLNLVPFHHDEGVNGNFLVRLVRDGFYQYDPANYHGPTLYYFSAIIPWTVRFFAGTAAQNSSGLTSFNVRLIPVLFGLGTIWLILSLRRHLGTIGALAAAGLVAISPGAVYLSRYFIHESMFVFFTLGIVVAAIRYYEVGHPIYLILAFSSGALLFATKETSIISAGVLAIALLAMVVYANVYDAVFPDRDRIRTSTGISEWWQETIERLGGSTKIAIWLGVGVVVFVALSVLFYSSFFTNGKGVNDSIKTFEVWSKTGQTAHVHPFSTYLTKWLIFQELPVYALGLLGAAIVVLRPRNRFALFAALWAFGITVAYSLVSYKTPWLMLNFVIPLALIGGYVFEWIYRELGKWDVEAAVLWAALLGLFIVTTGMLPGLVALKFRKDADLKALLPGYQTIDLNFINYDNDDQYYVYVYAHTRRDLLKMIDEIEHIVQRTSTRQDTGITIVSPDYWPLPWYFRDYNHVGYFARMTASTEPIIIASETQRAEMERNFGGNYKQVNSGLNGAGNYSLRPGVDLLLYQRRDVASP